MPVVTLDSLKKKKGSDDEGQGGNEYYTGGLGEGGSGSGLAVVAPTQGDDQPMRQIVNRLQREQAAQGGGVEPRNGFTVDNGPLRTIEDPQSKQFLESLLQGICPAELVVNGQPADVRLENRLHEDYESGGGNTAPQFSAFTGSGSAVGQSSERSSAPIIAGTQGNGAPLIVNEAASGLVRVQVKFPDGKREVIKFEKQHTVRHLIARIELRRPELSAYHLLTGGHGPPTPIESSQFDMTLTDAGLAGALVTVKEQ